MRRKTFDAAAVRRMHGEYIEYGINYVIKRYGICSHTVYSLFEREGLPRKGKPSPQASRIIVPHDELMAMHREYMAGAEANELAERHFMSRPTMTLRFREAGLPGRKRRGQRSPEYVQHAYKLYLTLGASRTAAELDISTAVLYQMFDRFGLPSRKRIKEGNCDAQSEN